MYFSGQGLPLIHGKALKFFQRAGPLSIPPLYVQKWGARIGTKRSVVFTIGSLESFLRDKAFPPSTFLPCNLSISDVSQQDDRINLVGFRVKQLNVTAAKYALGRPCRRAADNGFAMAYTNLGAMNANGLGGVAQIETCVESA